jgi:hypothetical protein
MLIPTRCSFCNGDYPGMRLVFRGSAAICHACIVDFLGLLPLIQPPHTAANERPVEARRAQTRSRKPIRHLTGTVNVIAHYQTPHLHLARFSTA